MFLMLLLAKIVLMPLADISHIPQDHSPHLEWLPFALQNDQFHHRTSDTAGRRGEGGIPIILYDIIYTLF